MKCVVCGRERNGNNEWLHVKRGCPVVVHADVLVANTAVVANSPVEKVANKAPALVANKVANRHGKYADPVKRREYMKRYMARRRAGHGDHERAVAGGSGDERDQCDGLDGV